MEIPRDSAISSFFFQRTCVVEQDKAGAALPGKGKIAAAKLRREEYGRGVCQQRSQLSGTQRRALSARTGEGEEHPQPLGVQGDMLRAKPLDGTLQILPEAAAGDGGAEDHHSPGRDAGAAFRKKQDALDRAKRFSQLPDKGLVIIAQWLFKVQHHTGILPPAAFPFDRGAKSGGIRDGRCVTVADGKKTAPALQQVLPQEGGSRSDAIGGVGDGAGVFCGGGFVKRRGGEENLHVLSPLCIF